MQMYTKYKTCGTNQTTCLLSLMHFVASLPLLQENVTILYILLVLEGSYMRELVNSKYGGDRRYGGVPGSGNSDTKRKSLVSK